MIVYAYVKKGEHHRNGVCQDTVLLSHLVMSSGSIRIAVPQKFLVGVADGVGGHRAGEAASGLTASLLSQAGGENLPVEALRIRLAQVNETIAQIARGTEKCRGMASTFVGFYRLGEKAYVLWAGNSRLYQVTGDAGHVMQLTVDHNQKNDWLENGEIDSLDGVKGGEALTAYVGMPEAGFAKRLETEEIYLPGTKRFFLTSDGIHDHIPPEKLAELMGSGRPAEELLPELANEAVAGGSTDDRSVVMLEWEERGE